jgi:hypothetical protein
MESLVKEYLLDEDDGCSSNEEPANTEADFIFFEKYGADKSDDERSFDDGFYF